MRLSYFEQKIIKQTIVAIDIQAKIVLFGSRVDDLAKGGDIDLLIISDVIAQSDLVTIRWQLWEKLGQQKIDLVLSNSSLRNTFAQKAYGQGVRL